MLSHYIGKLYGDLPVIFMIGGPLGDAWWTVDGRRRMADGGWKSVDGRLRMADGV